MMRESIRRGPVVCDSSYPCSTHEVSCKHFKPSSSFKCHKKYGTGRMKLSSKICHKKDTGKHETPSKNSSEICQPDNIPSSSSENSSMNMNSDDNTKECILNPVNMDDCSILQHEQCNDTQSNQSIFFDLLSKLERHLDEERKANAKLQVELMNKTEYEKQISDLRSNYEAEVFRLQNVITRLQGNSHYNDKISHDDEKLANLNTEVNEVNVRRNNDTESNTDKCIKPVQNFTSMDELKKEYAKQELLIAGYQRENEKLVEVEQLNKELKLRSQQICTMLSGNSRLNQENRINELQELNKQLDNERNKLTKELNDARLELTNMNLKMNNHIREKNDLLEKYENFKEKSQTDCTNMKETYLCQIEDLQKKLRWYIENQSIIIKDSKKLQNQARELEKLQAELSYFKSKQVSGPKSSESKQPHNSKDLSNESEQAFLLQRIKFLESELDRAHENEKRAIRALQQQYEQVKLQYEDRIQSLESYINSYCIHNQTYSPLLSKDENSILTSNDLKNPEILQKSLKQLKNSNQSIILSNLLDDLRGQITNLKIQLKQRQKTIEQMKHFAQLNSNHLNNNNKFKPLIHKNKQCHYSHLYEIQSRQINKINDKINLRKNKIINSNEQNNEHVSINDKESISLKEHNALKNLLQSRITKLEIQLKKSQESVKSGVTCDASTNTDFIERTDDSYIKIRERQFKNQIDTIVSRQTELNRLKKLMTNRNKHYHPHLHHHLHNGDKSEYDLNTSQYTNENIPSSLLQIEDHSYIEEYMNEMYTNPNYCTNLEADYWRNIALKMNNELNHLQNDANILVNILTELQQ
uniref:Centrosomal protein of 162 kDa n=1 Tax=Schistosoma haematobium TaxID=6185 RepID=A0A095C8X7_SCHHA